MAFEVSFGESKENNRRHRKWTWMDVEHITENLQSDQRKPARGSGRESDAAKMPRNIFRYVLETSGLHQLFLLLLTVGVFLLEVVPLELQRRIVNDPVKHWDYRLVIVLCAVYAGAVLVQGGTKLVLNVYRSWVGERATRDLRRRVRVLVSSPSPASSGSEAQGIQASMIVAEVEPIGGFVGASVSEPLLQGGVLLSVLAYMIHVDLWMGGTALALFLPQLVFVPLMQGAINRRTGARVQIIRRLSVSVVEATSGDDARDQTADGRIDRVFELNMGIFRFKFTMNFLSRQSRNQTGGEDKTLPRPCGQFWMIRRSTSAQFVPANAGAKAKNPVGSTLFSTPSLHSSATPATRFFARVVASQLVRD